MKFAMYGSGAAGSVFASYLRKGGADIILIDRYEAHMKKVAEEGMHFTIHQEEDGGYKDYDYQLKGFRTYITAADAAAAEGKVDVIIYMTKATQLEQAIQDSLPVVGDSTVAVSLINGLGNDDNLFKVFPKERCIIGSGVLGTALPEPAHCVSTPAGGVQMNFGGAVRSELNDAACAEMLKCYRDGGCDAYWRDGEPGTDNNIYKFIWKKVCVNATVNTVCAVLRLKIGEVEADPFGQWLFHSVIRETCAVATAKGRADGRRRVHRPRSSGHRHQHRRLLSVHVPGYALQPPPDRDRRAQRQDRRVRRAAGNRHPGVQGPVSGRALHPGQLRQAVPEVSSPRFFAAGRATTGRQFAKEATA